MNPNDTRIAPDWYRRAFDALYPVIYAHRTVESAKPEAAFAVERLRVTSGERVLDLACGNGRHLAHLLRRTPNAVGLDYSAALLKQGRANVGPDAALVRADMRCVPFVEAFDALTNFFTSFGYFFTEAENLSTVRAVAQALKPSGRFLIDYLNRAHAEAHLVPRSLRHVGEYEIAEERWIDATQHRINKSTRVFCRGENIENQEESVRLYEYDELADLLERGGLRVDEAYGDFTGDAYAPSSPRMILLGHKE